MPAIGQVIDNATVSVQQCFFSIWRYAGSYQLRSLYQTGFPQDVASVDVHGVMTTYRTCGGFGVVNSASYAHPALIYSWPHQRTCPPYSRFVPGSSTTCRCDANFAANQSGKRCDPVVSRYFYPDPEPSCSAADSPSPPSGGNPVLPLTGTKSQAEVLGFWMGQLVTARYDTRTKVPSATHNEFMPSALPSFGELWRSSLHKSLSLQRSRQGQTIGVQVHRGGWNTRSFVLNASGRYVSQDERFESLEATSGAAAWVYKDLVSGDTERYSNDGRLLDAVSASGRRLSYEYSTTAVPTIGLLLRIVDSFGNSLQFEYELPPGVPKPRITRIVDSAQLEVLLTYDDKNNLKTIKRSGEPPRSFLYEDASQPWALTGVVTEDNQRRSSYTYDMSGRARSSELAGGVDRYSLDYQSPPVWNIVETPDEAQQVVYRDYFWQLPVGASMSTPSGQSAGYSFQTIKGRARLTGQSQPAGSGCSASASAFAYDSQGNLQSRDDFNGSRTCFARDASGREVAMVDGLPGGESGTSCTPVTQPGAALPAGSRKTSTQWHPDWTFVSRQAQAGKITTSIYNGQSDPFNNGAAASCAPVNARLPDGKPIAVLCKRVEQATTDANGALGFAAPLQAGVLPRVSSWTYNALGQVLTATDAAGGTSVWRYHEQTSGDFTLGDLQSTTNAAGHTTLYTHYNKLGKPLRMIDPNGVVTTYTYDTRQRLLTSTVAGLTTTYTYTPTGSLRRVTRPDGSFIGYEYDAAGRQTAVLDHLGNRIDYTLDAAGNRVSETAKDSAGVLRRAMSRSFDALNRVQLTQGREVQP